MCTSHAISPDMTSHRGTPSASPPPSPPAGVCFCLAAPAGVCFCVPVLKTTRCTPMESSTRRQRTHGRELPKRAASRQWGAAAGVGVGAAVLLLLLLRLPVLVLVLLLVILGAGSKRTT